MRKGLRRWAAAGLFVVAAVVTGCSNGPASLSGSISLDGKPLDGATITLYPDKKDSGAGTVVGTTRPDGQFVITPSAGKWIARGSYTMVVSKRPEPTPEQAERLIIADEMLPAKYSNVA